MQINKNLPNQNKQIMIIKESSEVIHPKEQYRSKATNQSIHQPLLFLCTKIVQKDKLCHVHALLKLIIINTHTHTYIY